MINDKTVVLHSSYYYYPESRAVVSTHLDDLIDEAHMSDRVSLFHQDFLQMLHLRNMQHRELHVLFIHTLFNSLAECLSFCL